MLSGKRNAKTVLRRCSGWACLAILMVAGGCFGDPPPPFAGQAHGLKISLRSTTDLNQYSDRAHALALYIIQAESPKPLQAAKGSTEECLKLLQAAGKTEGITRFEMLEVQPGAKMVDFRDLVANTAWVGIVAAYYNMDAKKCVLAYVLPSGDDKSLSVDLILGPANILKSEKIEGNK